MNLPRRVSVLLTALLTMAILLLGAPTTTALAQETTTPLPPVTTPDTSSCPYRYAPPPATSTSEAVAPGTAPPAQLPVPPHPVGGTRMGECGLVAPAGAPAPPADITAASWLVADLDTGDVLATKDPHGRHRPASTIKLLTALVAAQRLPMDKTVIGTQADADVEGSGAGIGPGGRYTVHQLLAGLLLESGNDAAFALARAMGGIEPTLAAMQQQATALGATDTRPATPSGLDGPGMSTSAYDLALVFRAVAKNRVLSDLMSTRQFPFPGYGGKPGFVLNNENKLLANYPGAFGGKTGFTDDSRHTYVGAAEQGGRRLVVVLMRGEQRPIKMYQQGMALLDYGFGIAASREQVGKLVTPQAERQHGDGSSDGEVQAAPAAHTSAQGDESGGGRSTAAGAIAVGIAALIVLGGVAWRQRRRGG